MSLSYAGIDLLLDPNCEIADWLDKYSPLEDLRLFGNPPSFQKRSQVGRSSSSSYGWPLPNWSQPPRLRLNTLFWPVTGATRWAYFVGFVDEARLDQIVAALATGDKDSTNKHGELRISEEPSYKNRFLRIPAMYMLPPRRVSIDARAGAVKGWLLPLVDQRYLWRMTDVGSVTASAETGSWTWGLLLGSTKLGSVLPYQAGGFDLNSPHADYQLPDASEFDRLRGNAAAVLDAAAESVGMRVVQGTRGTVYLMNTERSAQFLTEALTIVDLEGETAYDIIHGGKADKYNAIRVPSKVVVMFPKRNADLALNTGGYHAVEVTPSAVGLSSDVLTHNGTKIVYTTAYAEMGGDATVENSAACTTLATRMARDYFNWLLQNYDYTFAGLKSWKLNGFDDWFIVQYEPNLITRVMSHPMDFGVGPSDQLQQFEASYPTSYTGKLATAVSMMLREGYPQLIGQIAAGGDGVAPKSNCTVTVFSGVPGSETTANLQVSAWNEWGSYFSGDLVWLAQSGAGWYVIAPLSLQAFQVFGTATLGPNALTQDLDVSSVVNYPATTPERVYEDGGLLRFRKAGVYLLSVDVRVTHSSGANAAVNSGYVDWGDGSGNNHFAWNMPAGPPAAPFGAAVSFAKILHTGIDDEAIFFKVMNPTGNNTHIFRLNISGFKVSR